MSYNDVVRNIEEGGGEANLKRSLVSKKQKSGPLYTTHHFPCIASRAVASSIIGGGGGGLIFIYSRSAQLISFEIDCFYGV